VGEYRGASGSFAPDLTFPPPRRVRLQGHRPGEHHHCGSEKRRLCRGGHPKEGDREEHRARDGDPPFPHHQGHWMRHDRTHGYGKHNH